MPVGWFIAPYKRRDPSPGEIGRYCAMDDFTAQIVADGGAWAETEILGNAALVKVRAAAGTLTTIAAGSGFLRIPNHFDLNDTLGDLTAGQRNAILNELQTLGYSPAEITAALPANWATVTLGQLLRFAAGRRLRPRYDSGTDTIICDGPPQPVLPVDQIAALVN
jgi:hypothetical protein